MENTPPVSQQPVPAGAEPSEHGARRTDISRQRATHFAKETWAGFSKPEKYILWVFFGLGGGFILLMLLATVANIVHRFTG